MRCRFVAVAAVLMTVLPGGCGSPEFKPVEQLPPAYEPEFDADGTELELCEDRPSTPVHILQLGVVEDQVVVRVAYGGGCAAHYFKLCWDETLSEEAGLPAADLRILHEGNQDSCQAAWEQTLVFDLTPLWAIADPSAPVLLRLDTGLAEHDLEEHAFVVEPGSGPETWCDPLEGTCGLPGHVCQALGPDPGPAFGCGTPDPGRQQGEDCQWGGCAAGLYCEPDPERVGCEHALIGCCNALCNLDAPDTSCPGAADGETCIPWSDPAPAGFETLGVCVPG